MQGMTPCPNVSSGVMFFHIASTALTTILVAFLTHRRLRKDEVDERRWSNNNVQHAQVFREVRKTTGASTEDEEAP